MSQIDWWLQLIEDSGELMTKAYDNPNQFADDNVSFEVIFATDDWLNLNKQTQTFI